MARQNKNRKKSKKLPTPYFEKWKNFPPQLAAKFSWLTFGRLQIFLRIAEVFAAVLGKKKCAQKSSLSPV